MEKINVAELLKDCPSGMELDCLLFKDTPVYFQRITNACYYPIEIKVEYPDGSFEIFELSKEGCIYDRITAKCVIFPKGKTTWNGFQRPFKDGDIVYNRLQKRICIYTKDKGYPAVNYCRFNELSQEFEILDFLAINVNDYRLATEKEKEKLFKVIEEHGYKWNADTKTLEKLIEPKFKVGDKIRHLIVNLGNIYTVLNVETSGYTLKKNNECVNYHISFDEEKNWELVPNKFDITSLKSFDKVLVRNDNKQLWTVDMFSFYDKNLMCPFVCVGHYTNQCIPYEGNEHLRGTTGDCDEYFKVWK